MKVTTRGRAFLSAEVALLFGAILFQDLLMLTAFLVFAAVTVGEAIWVWVVTRRPARWFSISRDDAGADPLSISRVLHPGESRHDDMYFLKKVGGGATLLSKIPFLKVAPYHFEGRGVASKVGADFRTPFAGRYTFDAFELEVTGPLKVVSSTCALPAKAVYSVFPQVLGVALLSAKLLGKGGTGESSVESPGIGTEFYGVRKYQPGDYYRQINWKATARRGEPMTNEHMREVGGAFYLALEAVSPDYFDRDRLAATFLALANALTMQGERFGVLIHDGEKVVQFKKIDAPAASLAFCLKVAFEFADLEPTAFEDELAAMSSHALRPVRKFLAARGSELLSQLEDFSITEKRALVENKDPSQAIMGLIREDIGNPPAVVCVTGMFGSIEPIIELGSELKRVYGANFVVADPTAPWVSAPDEESAYDAYSRYTKNINALRGAAIEYQIGEPSSLVQRIMLALAS
jgi:hypothetical protein